MHCMHAVCVCGLNGVGLQGLSLRRRRLDRAELWQADRCLLVPTTHDASSLRPARPRVLRAQRRRAVLQAVLIIVIMSEWSRPTAGWRHRPRRPLPDLWLWRWRQLRRYLRHLAAVERHLVSEVVVGWNRLK